MLDIDGSFKFFRKRLTVRRDGTSGVFVKCVDEIVQGGLKDGEKSQTGHGEPDHRGDPWIPVKIGLALATFPSIQR